MGYDFLQNLLFDSNYDSYWLPYYLNWNPTINNIVPTNTCYGVLWCKNLRVLRLNNNQIKNLESIRKIKNSCVQYIEPIANLPKLSSLNLHGNPITPNDLPAEWKGPTLKLVDIIQEERP